MSAVTAGSGRPRVAWREAEVRRVVPETAEAVTLVLDVQGWPGHRAGQHVDVRLTAEDGYQAQRSYSIGSAPEQPELALTVERLDDGEVSPYLVDVVRAGDRFELRGPIGGWFTWDAPQGGPLLLIAGGSGLVPLMAMLRHATGRQRRRGAPAAVDPEPRRRALRPRARGDRSGPRRHRRAHLHTQPARGLDRLRAARRPPHARGGPRPPADRPQAFVCGPTAFVEAVADALVALGHDPDRILMQCSRATGG